MHSIFVPLVGQYDNIGDIVLRRTLLRWVADAGKVHCFTGRSPSDYDEALFAEAVPAVVYRGFSQFYRDLCTDKTASYVFKPGELQMTAAGMKEHVAMVPALLIVRRRGGGIVRVGAGVRSAGFRGWSRLVMPSVRLSSPVVWRESTGQQLFGGEIAPDLALMEGSAVDEMRSEAERSLITVSLRYDRILPSPEWASGLRAIAGRGHRLVVVSQVRRDDARTRAIAEVLGAEACVFGDRSCSDQEQIVRDLYAQSLITVSDRLHVLFMALTEGSAPVCNLPDTEDKIGRHMRAAGISGRWGTQSATSVEDYEEVLRDRTSRIRELASARRSLETLHLRVRSELGDPSRYEESSSAGGGTSDGY